MNSSTVSNLTPPSIKSISNNAQYSTSISKEAGNGVPLNLKDPLQYLQQQFAYLNMDGRLSLVDLTSLERRTNQGIAAKLSLSNLQDGNLLIRRALRAKFQDVNLNDISIKFAHSPDTRCYSGVEFNPAGNSEGYLNLWVGPTTQPKAGEWQRIAAFLHEVICDKDEACYQYLIHYIAHALQRPEEKPGVMIAMMSGQGTGKGTLARILRKIWSATFMQIHNINDVTGNFNASLERAYIVFMDEALFSGDRRASDALKSLVTESVIQINEKHQPARQISSYHRFFAATNAEHFKNTERDDRRDLVLRLSESRKGDHEYWKALNAEIDGGGVEAMMHDLLVLDLAAFNVRDKPDTNELLEQKLQSLNPIQRWWHDRLYQGFIDGEPVGNGFTEVNAKAQWPEFLSTLAAIQGVITVSGGRFYRKPAAIDMAKAIKEMCPSARQEQVTTQGSRKRGFVLPELEQARSDFDRYIGGKVAWGDTPQ